MRPMNRPVPTAEGAAALARWFVEAASALLIRRPSVVASSANVAAAEVDENDLRFGAFATLPELGHPIYRLRAGTAVAVADVAFRALNQPSFLSDLLGDAHNRLSTSNCRSLTFIDYGGGGAIMPPIEQLSGRSTQIFDRLMVMASRFVSLHEQGHYYNGHLHAIRDVGGIGLIEVGLLEGNEAVSAEEGADLEARMQALFEMPWPRACRALELQADAWAARHLFGFGRRDATNGAAPEEGYADAADWFRHAALGAALIVVLFEVNDRNVTTPAASRRHPPAAERFLTLLQELGQHFPSVLPDLEAMVRFMERLVDDLDALFSAAGVTPLSPEDVNAAFSGTTLNTPHSSGWRACIEDLIAIMPRLSPFGDVAEVELGGLTKSGATKPTSTEESTEVSGTR